MVVDMVELKVWYTDGDCDKFECKSAKELSEELLRCRRMLLNKYPIYEGVNGAVTIDSIDLDNETIYY